VKIIIPRIIISFSNTRKSKEGTFPLVHKLFLSKKMTFTILLQEEGVLMFTLNEFSFLMEKERWKAKQTNVA